MKATGVDSSMISILSQGQLTRTRSGASLASRGSTSPRIGSMVNGGSGERSSEDDHSGSGKRLLPRNGSGRSLSSNGSRGTDLADIGENVAEYDGDSTESDSGMDRTPPTHRVGLLRQRRRVPDTPHGDEPDAATLPPPALRHDPSLRVMGHVNRSSRDSEGADGHAMGAGELFDDTSVAAAFMITPSTRRLIRNHAKSGPGGRRRRHTIATSARQDLGVAASFGGAERAADTSELTHHGESSSTPRHSPPARSPSGGDVRPPLPRRSFRAPTRGRSRGRESGPTPGEHGARTLTQVVESVSAATGVEQAAIQRLVFRHISSAAVENTKQAILSWEAGFLAAVSLRGRAGAAHETGERSSGGVKRTTYGPDASYVALPLPGARVNGKEPEEGAPLVAGAQSISVVSGNAGDAPRAPALRGAVNSIQSRGPSLSRGSGGTQRPPGGA